MEQPRTDLGARAAPRLNAITQRLVEPLPHVDQLVDETRGARFFTKLDLVMAYMQFRIREDDQFKTSFRVPGGQYEFRVGTFGLPPRCSTRLVGPGRLPARRVQAVPASVRP